MEFITKDTFFLKMAKIPTGTAQQRKIGRIRGRVRTYPSDSYMAAKRILKLHLKRHIPKIPYQAPIYLSVAYRYEASSKKKIGTFKTTRPDGDNLLKVFKDCMTDLGFFEDDSLVVFESIARYWVAKGEGGISVTIGEIKEEVF